MTDYLWIIPAAPCAAAVLNGVFGKKIGKFTAAIAITAVAAAFLVALYVAATILGSPEEVRQPIADGAFYQWVVSGDFKVVAGYYIDPLSSIMLLVVTSVSLLVHIYSVGYMADDDGFWRFFTYLPLFTFAMLLLVLANNLLQLFLGWEGVGLCSYLLIGFWYNRKSATDAAMKAFIVNRVGDFGFMIGLILVWLTFGSITFSDVFAKAGTIGVGVLTMITLLLFVGACGKSAQIPLYTWLPDAMEGPTPVSALIHAATMVTAGVYMVARMYPLFIHTPITLGVVAWVGGITAIFAASIGLVQNDIKRILAYSTVSQLGYMFLALGVVVPMSGIFHLFTHAFFKGCLFLCAGAVIHSVEHAFHHGGKHDDPQDIRNMGGLRHYMPWTAWTFLAACLAISGIFPLAGFWSKDEILGGAFDHGQFALYAIGLVTAMMTAFYMFREYFLVFEGQPRFETEHVHPHESPWWMVGPLVVLAFLSVVIGAAVGAPPSKFHEFLSPAFVLSLGQPEPEAFNAQTVALMGVSLLIAIIGIWIAWMMYVRRAWSAEALAARFPRLYDLLLHKWYVDELYDSVFVQPALGFARFLWAFDGYVIDGIVNGIGYLTRGIGRGLRTSETGVVGNYALGIAAGLVAILGSFLLKGLVTG
ncbi:MAG TPA: NADH-quinone oxidoreductase subunit L [Chloroflexota bacterium]|nr:NADH-quinone oxidoreductase subunit L [Chloroflexota bacterium]